MKTLNDLFEHQLKDLYSAECQLLKAIPKMLENANDEKLRTSFKNHLEETEKHKERLAKICKELDITPDGAHCKAMEGLIKEAEGFIKHDADRDVKDVGLIAEAQRIEHYEISAYGTVVRYAKELGFKDIAQQLQETLDEEYNCDEKLTNMAEDRLNRKAKENA